MQPIKNRVIRVGLEINGELKIYQGLDVSAQGTKYTNPLQNEATIAVKGLSAETRNYILSQTTRHDRKKTPSRVTLEVGRVGGEVWLMYIGDIVSAELAMPPELTLTIKAKTNNANKAKVVVTQGAAIRTLNDISKEVARNNSLGLDFQATDKNIANYAYTGTPAQQIQDLQQAGGVSAYIDDDKLIVKDYDKAQKGRRRILNEKSGMIGLPRSTEVGADVTYIVDGESLLGGQLTIDSKINPSLNDDYIIEQLKFDVRSHADQFYYIASCRRLNG